MKIVKASLEEIDLIVPLFDQYRVFYQQASDINLARNFIHQRLLNKDSVIFLAINKDEKGAGFTQLYPSFSSVSVKTVLILNDLFVDEKYRRFGVGKQLMEQAKNYAITSNAKGIALETGVNNHSAQKLYDLLGYKKEIDVYHYFLNLNEG